jgi:ribosomal protein S18 acetylase RimI-like enzyme
MIEIKKATIEDLNAIISLGKQTYTETFAKNNTPENNAKYLNENFNSNQLSAEISNPNSSFYLAYYENLPIGFLKINQSDAQTEFFKESTLEIQRIYVLQAFHGKKIGQLLLEKAIEIAKQLKVDYIWLGVWEGNHNALGFYTKNGFVTFDSHVFILGDDQQTDLLMKLKIETKQ